jgi:hypothetical protein
MSRETARYVLVKKDPLLAETLASAPVSRSRTIESKELISEAPVEDSKEAKTAVPSMLLMKNYGNGGKGGDALIRARLGMSVSGTWVTTAATSTQYAGLMTPNGCTEFASYKTLYEQYRVKRIVARLWTGDVNFARSVSGTSVCTGVPIATVWARTPLPSVVTFDSIVDMSGHQVLDYGTDRNLHAVSYSPKGCYADVGSTDYENLMDWQSTLKAGSHVWGTYCFASSGQVSTAGGIPYSVTYLFDVEFRRRRYSP